MTEVSDEEIQESEAAHCVGDYFGDTGSVSGKVPQYGSSDHHRGSTGGATHCRSKRRDRGQPRKWHERPVPGAPPAHGVYLRKK